jgi:CelD/BcsL family acetyltransferase involved in cellulose biosynthesis
LLGYVRTELGGVGIALGDSPANGAFCAALQRALGNDRCPRALSPQAPCTSVAPHCAAMRRTAIGGWCALARDLQATRRVCLGEGFARYLEGRPKKVRHELRRKARKLERAVPGVTLACFRHEHERELAFATIAAVEQRSWKRGAGTAMICDPAERSFYERIYEHAARRDAVRVYALTAGAEPLAYVLGMFHGATFFALKTSYCAERAELAPGCVLFVYVIEALCAEGRAAELELLGADSRWKQELASAERLLCTYELRPATACARLGAAVHHHLRPAVKRGLAAVGQRWPDAARWLRRAAAASYRAR